MHDLAAPFRRARRTPGCPRRPLLALRGSLTLSLAKSVGIYLISTPLLRWAVRRRPKSPHLRPSLPPSLPVTRATRGFAHDSEVAQEGCCKLLPSCRTRTRKATCPTTRFTAAPPSVSPACRGICVRRRASRSFPLHCTEQLLLPSRVDSISQETVPLATSAQVSTVADELRCPKRPASVSLAIARALESLE